jgi:hypothetical protein
MKKLLPLIALVAWTTAHAEFLTGNDLLTKMRRNETSQLEAIMYIAGVADALRGVVSCPPAEVTLGQVYDMVQRNLERNPETRHRPGDWFVATVMRATWPCKQGTRL